jgi:hypothetical protein
MPEQHLVTEDLAAYWVGRPASTIRRWAAEGRITRVEDHTGRRNGVRYDLWELPAAVRDEDTKAVLEPGQAPPPKNTAALTA